MNVYKLQPIERDLAPAHFGQWGTQFFQADGTSKLTVSIKHYLPNGGTAVSNLPELAYYVLSGSITVMCNDEEYLLNAGDLIHIAEGKERLLKVNGQVPASVMVMAIG